MSQAGFRSLLISLGLAALIGVLPRAPYAGFFLLVVLTALLRRPLVRRIALIAVGFGFVVFTVTTRVASFSFHSPVPQGYYAQLLQSFEQGKLSMPYRADPGLAALKNPYDWPAAARYFSSPDLTYFNRQYYIYWGAAPILTFLLPYRLMTGAYPSEPLQMIWFACLTLLFFFLAGIRWIERRQGTATTSTQELLLMCALLFCTLLGPVASQAQIYGTAIIAGLAHAAIALYLIQKKSRRTDLLSGTFAALAFGSRPTLVLVAFPIFLLRWVETRPGLWDFFQTALRFAAGFAPIALAVMLYNYLRFQDPFEFGYRYLIALWDFHEWHWDTVSEAIGVGSALLQPYELVREFPGVKIDFFGTGWLIQRHRYLHDVNVGLLFSAPFVLIALISQAKEQWRWAHTTTFAFYGATLTMILTAAARAGTSLRYTLESGIFAVLTATVFLLTRKAYKPAITVGLLTLFWYCFNAGFLLSLEPNKNEWARSSPRAYSFLDQVIQPNIKDPRVVVPPPPMRPVADIAKLVEGIILRDRFMSRFPTSQTGEACTAPPKGDRRY